MWLDEIIDVNDSESDDADESSSKVVKLVDQCIIAAYRKSSSDIHIEPSPVSKATTLRFRLDGVCQEYLKVPNSLARGILSRVKIMSHLDIAERRKPQDGKINFRLTDFLSPLFLEQGQVFAFLGRKGIVVKLAPPQVSEALKIKDAKRVKTGEESDSREFVQIPVNIPQRFRQAPGKGAASKIHNVS